jgi:hypothetical protein
LIIAGICKIGLAVARLFDAKQSHAQPAAGGVEVTGRGAEAPVSQELRHVGGQESRLLEAGRRFMTEIP